MVPVEDPHPGPGTDEDEPAVDGRRSSAQLEISNAIVRLLKEHYGKGPTSVKTHLLGDVVVVLTRGGFTQVEHTLHSLGHGQAVLEQRRVFQQVMTERFRAVIAEATGREVLAALSAAHLDPDISCETFVLGSAPARP